METQTGPKRPNVAKVKHYRMDGLVDAKYLVGVRDRQK